MNKNKSFGKVFLFAMLTIALLLTGCASTTEASTPSLGKVSAITAKDSIETSGNLSADQLSSLTWGTSGNVEKVNVKVGQTVKAGDVLAILKADSVSSDVLTAQAALATAQNELDDLLNSQSAQAAAQLAVANAEDALATAQKAVDSVDFPRASDALINYTEAQITQQKRAVAMAADKYRLMQRRADGDPLKTEAELALTNAQLELNTLTATYNWYTGDPTSVERDLAAANLASAKATLADAKRAWEKIKNGLNAADVAAAQAKVAVAQATVNSMAILAPFDGKVLTVRTAVGNPVNSGDVAVELVNLKTLKVDALIDETSISSVKTGDTAEITMDLLPGVTLTGKVTSISSIGTTVNGLVKYTVTIALDPTEEAVKFGATANITLYTSAPHTALTVPLTAIQTDSQGEYVTLVKASGSTQRIAVESGDLTNGLVTITAAGLNEGDQIQLGSASATTSTTSSSSKNNNAGGPPDGGVPLPGGGPG